MKRSSCVSTLAVAACLVLPSTTVAQDEPTLGVTIGYPASVGVLWQITDRVALRPDLEWNWSSTESTSVFNFGSGATTIEGTLENQTVTLGVSALFTLREDDAFDVYVGGRVGYGRATLTTTTMSTAPPLPPPFPTVPPRGTETTELESSGYELSGFLGGRYTLGQRFGVFGEVGPAYTRSESERDSPLANDSRGRSVGLRGGVGVVVFF